MQIFLAGFFTGMLFYGIFDFAFYLARKKEKEEKKDKKGNEPVPEKKEIPEPEIQEEPEFRLSEYKEYFLSPGARVLIVDDSKLSRQILIRLLRQTKMKLTEAENGQNCLDILKRESFDLILLDQMMPGMNGIETLRKLRDLPLGKDVPVVAIGANVQENGREQLLSEGFAGAVGKPVPLPNLLLLFHQLLPKNKVITVPEGFSYENGLKNFDGNDSAYRETLALFSEVWEERKEQLKVCLDQNDMKSYAILIHGIKGDSRILGAEFLAKMAYEQEIAAKAGNTEAVQNSYQKVIETGNRTAEYFKTYGATQKKDENKET